MTEVFGIIAAVAGVADVGFKLSVTLYKYSHAVASPSEAIINIQPEVSLLSAVLKQLEFSLKDDESLRLCKSETLAETRGIAETISTALMELNDIIGRYFTGEKVSLGDRLKRYQMEKKVNLLRANLDHLKTTIILMLEVIKYARGIATHQQSPRERDREVLLALKRADDDAALRYDKLLKAIENSGSRVEDYFSSFEISSNTEVSDSNGHSYAIIDENEAVLSQSYQNNDLGLKFENISRLIDEVEECQRQIAEVTNHPCIWESFVGADEHHHFRHTKISRHPKMPKTEKARGLAGPQHPVQHKITDVYVALMGVVGSGKSTFINLCCGEDLAKVSQGLEHCTEKIGEYHFMYTTEIRVHLIDTPGFADAHRSEREILTELEEWVSQSDIPTTRLSGIIYFHKISDIGMHSAAHRQLRLFEKLCGPDALHSIILATTHWDFPGDQEAATLREQDLRTHDEYWGLMIKRGSSVLRHTGDIDSAMRILGTLRPLHHDNTIRNHYDHHMEPMDRKRGFTVSSIGLDHHSTEAKINQLLAEYTTVLDFPPPQQRRWTMDALLE